MNWFAIGGGIAMMIVGIDALARRPGEARTISRAAAITLGLVGLFYLILGAWPLFDR